ncbi:membrane protein [Corynebacterium pseudodiphtheriticum 090104]|nr:membrane protein [Corynebacterium pseudodiphtheriticum 090104]
MPDPKILRCQKNQNPQQTTLQKKEKPLQPPATIKFASLIAVVQSVIALIFAGVLIWREIINAENNSIASDAATANWIGAGTAGFIAIIFGTIVAAALSQYRGKRWGRGPIVLLQVILAASSFQMMSGGAVFFGIFILASAVIALLMIFHPQSNAWMELHYAPRRRG